MHKKQFIALCLLFSSLLNAQDSLIWLNHIKGKGHQGYITNTCDVFGNVFLSGNFSDSIDIDPGPNKYYLFSNQRCIYIQKLNKQGQLLWGKVISSDQNIVTRCIASDREGNLYLTGNFGGTTDFDPGPNAHTLTTHNTGTTNYGDAYILKLDPDGNFLWVKGIQTPDAGNIGFDIAFDSHNNVVATGWFYNTASFTPPSPSYNLTAVGDNDLYILKLKPNGNILWCKSIGGPDKEQSFALSVNKKDEILIAGHYWQTVDFDPGPALENRTAKGILDGFLLQLDSNGVFVKVTTITSNFDFQISDLSLDAQDNIYLVGTFDGTADVDPGPATHNIASMGGIYTIYVLKLDSSMNYKWSRTFGGAGYHWGQYIDVDSCKNVYIAGGFENTLYTDDGTALFTETGWLQNTYLIKLDSLGTVIQSYPMHATTAPWTSNNLTVKPDNTILYSGLFRASFALAPFALQDTLLTNGRSNTFMVNLSNDSCYLETPIDSFYLDTTNIENPIDTTVTDTLYTPVVLELPNVFTPNGDGKNEWFKPTVMQGVTRFNMQIYNRWGEMVFQSVDNNLYWNGQYNRMDCAEGVYFWLLNYRDQENSIFQEKGTVHLFR